MSLGPPYERIHDLFQAQAREKPHAIALAFGDCNLTYAEVERRANQLAHYLRSNGVGPEVVVGICLSRGPNMIVGLLGILKAAGAYLPLDPNNPVSRQEFMIKDAGALLTVTETEHVQTFTSANTQVLCLDDKRQEIAELPAGPIESQVDGQNLAYVMYTSGSTGVPKGVGVTHRSVIQLVRNSSFFEFGTNESFLQLTSLAFDASVLEIWASLLNGHRLVLMPPQPPTMSQIAHSIVNYEISTLQLTTALFHEMADSQIEAMANVPQTICGGEAMSVPHAQKMLDQLNPGYRLINAYGPTENTTVSCCHTMKAGHQLGNSVSIGQSINDSQCYVLDSSFHPVDADEVGELFVGGEGLARGYYGRPGLTAERFLPNPFSDTPGSRLYRTGDLVRQSCDGNLEFVGRVDNQVKLRGYRIELGEIEFAATQHRKVNQALAVVHQRENAEPQLVVYCVGARDGLEEEELRAFLADRLPGYMVPVACVMLKRFPLTANGKVDRNALPNPERSSTSRASAQPRSEFEASLLSLWSETLGFEDIGIHDNFFELGGDSLLAMRLLGNIEKQLGKPMPLSSLYSHGSVAEFAPAMKKGRTSGAFGATAVKLNNGQSGVPLVMAPGLIGEIGHSKKLAEHLPAGIPIYGLRLVSDIAYRADCDCLEKLAEYFVKALKAAIPTGPYQLLGYSFGAFVAFEIAKQLRDAGDQVHSVIILDYGPKPGQRSLTDSIFRDTPSILVNLPRWIASEHMVYAARKLLKRLTGRQVINNSPLNETEMTDEILERHGLHWIPSRYRQRALKSLEFESNYKPASYAGRVVVLRARTRPLFHQAIPDLGWGNFVSESVEAHNIPGSHGTIFSSKNITKLAKVIEQAIVAES